MNFNPLTLVRKRLALKILLPMAVVFMLASTAGVVAMGAMFNKYLEQQLIGRGFLVVSTLTDAARTMSSHDALQEFVARLSQQDDIDFVIIAGGTSLEVIACTDARLVGKPIGVLPNTDFADDLRLALNSGSPHFDFDQGGGTLLDISAPIKLLNFANQPGALMIHLRTAPLKSTIASLKSHMSIGFLVALAILLGSLLLLIKQWVLTPQQQILAAVNARNQGKKAFSTVASQDEFLTLSNAFNEMVRTGDEVELQKNRFVSTVSHELRTPLTSIKGGLSVFLSQKGKELEPAYRGVLEIALRNAGRLHAIINDLLDMEKINAEELVLTKENADLVALAKSAIEDCSDYAATHKVNITLETHIHQAWVYVDSKRIQQVLLNLLSNAAKFSYENGDVLVKLEIHDSHYRISVQDHGCGIPESFRPEMFKSFKQADNSATRAKGGTGLGLTISNRLLALHGTTLEYSSSVGVGTCFFFDLQIAANSINATEK